MGIMERIIASHRRRGGMIGILRRLGLFVFLSPHLYLRILTRCDVGPNGMERTEFEPSKSIETIPIPTNSPLFI